MWGSLTITTQTPSQDYTDVGITGHHYPGSTQLLSKLYTPTPSKPGPYQPNHFLSSSCLNTPAITAHGGPLAVAGSSLGIEMNKLLLYWNPCRDDPGDRLGAEMNGLDRWTRLGSGAGIGKENKTHERCEAAFARCTLTPPPHQLPWQICSDTQPFLPTPLASFIRTHSTTLSQERVRHTHDL